MAQTQSVREFLGERFEDMADATLRFVKQAGKGAAKGTLFKVRAFLNGSATAELVEDNDRRSGIDLKLTPGPVVTNIGGSLSGGWGTTRGIDANAGGGFQYGVEVEILNAVALRAEGQDGVGSAGGDA